MRTSVRPAAASEATHLYTIRKNRIPIERMPSPFIDSPPPILVQYRFFEWILVLQLEIGKRALRISQLPSWPLGAAWEGGTKPARSQDQVLSGGRIDELGHEVGKLVQLKSDKDTDDLPGLRPTHSKGK